MLPQKRKRAEVFAHHNKRATLVLPAGTIVPKIDFGASATAPVSVSACALLAMRVFRRTNCERAHHQGVSNHLKKGDLTMFTKIAIALVLIAGTASGALAQKRYSTSPAHDVFDISGKYVGSDPDPTVRGMIARDRD